VFYFRIFGNTLDLIQATCFIIKQMSVKHLLEVKTYVKKFFFFIANFRDF